ncbi:MAG: antitoxin VapB family protein [Candidatus Heimdallarchaeota archaeon]
MGYKSVSLSVEAYNVLKSLKREGESFSDVVLWIAHSPDIAEMLALGRAWKDIPVEEIEKLKKVARDR